MTNMSIQAVTLSREELCALLACLEVVIKRSATLEPQPRDDHGALVALRSSQRKLFNVYHGQWATMATAS